MLKNLKFPLLYVLEAALYLPALAGFCATFAFVESTPIANLNLKGKLLPQTWEAAVPNNGMFLEGYLIRNHPFAFFFALVLLLGSSAAIHHIRKAQAWQTKEAGAAGVMAHKIASAMVFAELAAIGYILVFRVLVSFSVAPA